jgi:hypothetical protein
MVKSILQGRSYTLETQVFSNQEKRNTVKKDAIVVRFDDIMVTDCSSAIIVPERAIDEAGYIKTLTANAHAHSKHEFHAMAQMACYQFQDGELEVAAVDGIITVEWEKEVDQLTAGMVIYRDFTGNFHVLAHIGQNWKKLLEVAHRFCTRWVRLDI